MGSLRKENPAATDDLVVNGQRLYDERLRAVLEPKHNDQFVAIEPESGQHFLGSTALAALRAGRAATPGKLFYLLRVGHDAAYRVGSYGARKR